MGPLSQMMMDNGDTIQKAIDDMGPSAVAEFFIAAGTGIAAAYEVTDLDPSKVSVFGGEAQE